MWMLPFLFICLACQARDRFISPMSLLCLLTGKEHEAPHNSYANEHIAHHRLLLLFHHSHNTLDSFPSFTVMLSRHQYFPQPSSLVYRSRPGPSSWRSSRFLRQTSIKRVY
ncbi:hypothetical protein DE146DRAFT_221665 [Phaeosphaeria sp. MPI-PUGE-AT-0046c]|nr:hypothetical protein DE146DRAFT_221665 [Phaeosphaeria sp. MPI-PUGE-AT-0046c]